MSNIDYYYRVDSIENLRGIEDHYFRPAIWNGDSGFVAPHKTFLDGHETLGEGEHFYRICFWVNNEDATKDLSFRSLRSKHLKLRIKVDDVKNSLRTYVDDVDDLIDDYKAKMFWKKCVHNGAAYSDDGIQFSLFEVEYSPGKWRNVNEELCLKSEDERMSFVEMQRIEITTAFGKLPVYWKWIDHTIGSQSKWLFIKTSRLFCNYLNDDIYLNQVFEMILMDSDVDVSLNKVGVFLVIGDGSNRIYVLSRAEKLNFKLRESNIFLDILVRLGLREQKNHSIFELKERFFYENVLDKKYSPLISKSRYSEVE